MSGTKDDLPRIPRGYLKVAQLKHKGDWQPAPRAMRNLMENVAQNHGVDVALKTETASCSARTSSISNSSTQANEFAFDAEELESLRFNLTNGGLLFADASCGREAFDKGFRKFAEALLPGKKLEPVPADDLLFSKDLERRSVDGTKHPSPSRPQRIDPQSNAASGRRQNRWPMGAALQQIRHRLRPGTPPIPPTAAAMTQTPR
ncbi:MAG: DUF4159 domain-containing protein [Gemmataceae bacterium]